MLQVERKTLSNDLRVLLLPLPHLHSATITYLVRAGSMYETPETNGLGHMTEHMVFRGTDELPSTLALNDAIEKLGGTLEGATQADLTEYELTLPPENVERGIELIASVVQAPILQGIEIEQRIIREEILEDLDENGVQTDVDNVSRDLIFKDHPLGYPITGSIEAVQAFNRDDVVAHIRDHYTARNSVLVVAGAFDGDAVSSTIENTFGKMARGDVVQAKRFDAKDAPLRYAHVNDTDSQTELRLAFHCAGARDADLPVLRLIDRILDDGLSSRLHQRICDELALAYDVFCGLEVYEDRSVFELGSAVEHEKARALVEACLELLGDLRDNLVPGAELDKAKLRYQWDLRSSVDSPESVAAYFGTAALFDLDRSLDTAAEQIQAVTSEDIQRVAKAFFNPAQAHLTTVGIQTDKSIAALKSLIGA